MNHFSYKRIVLESTFITSCLVVEHNDFRPAAYFFVVPEIEALAADRSAVHSCPDAVSSTCCYRSFVIEVPDFETSFVVPSYPLPVYLIVPVLFGRNFISCFFPETFLTVITIANGIAGQPAPAVIGKTFRLVLCSDLSEYRWNML